MAKKSVNDPGSLGWTDDGNGFWSWSGDGDGSDCAGMVVSATEPTDPIEGMQWLNSDTAEVFIFDGAVWLEFPAGSGGGLWETSGDDIFYNDGNVSTTGDFTAVDATFSGDVSAAKINASSTIRQTVVGYGQMAFDGTDSSSEMQIISTNHSGLRFMNDNGSIMFQQGTDASNIVFNLLPGGDATFSGTVTSSSLKTDCAKFASNQDHAYLVAGTAGWTGATDNWNTYGFQHRIKTNANGKPRVTIDTALGEKFSVDNDGSATFSGTVNATETQVNKSLVISRSNDTEASFQLRGALDKVTAIGIYGSGTGTTRFQYNKDFELGKSSDYSLSRFTPHLSIAVATGDAQFSGIVDVNGSAPEIYADASPDVSATIGFKREGKYSFYMTNQKDAHGFYFAYHDYDGTGYRNIGGYNYSSDRWKFNASITRFSGNVTVGEDNRPVSTKLDLLTTLITLRKATMDETQDIRESLRSAIDELVEGFEQEIATMPAGDSE